MGGRGSQVRENRREIQSIGSEVDQQVPCGLLINPLSPEFSFFFFFPFIILPFVHLFLEIIRDTCVGNVF